MESLVDTPSFLSYSPPDTAQDKERSAVLKNTLEKIKPEYKKALVLRYYDGLSPEQIGAVTGKNIKRVYNLLARGKTALKNALEKDGIRYEDL